MKKIAFQGTGLKFIPGIYAKIQTIVNNYNIGTKK